MCGRTKSRFSLLILVEVVEIKEQVLVPTSKEMKKLSRNPTQLGLSDQTQHHQVLSELKFG